MLTPTNEEEVLDLLKQISKEVKENSKATDDVAKVARKLDYQINGNPHVMLPSGDRDRGIVGTIYDHSRVVPKLDQAIKVAKGLTISFGATTMALVGNLIERGVFGG